MAICLLLLVQYLASGHSYAGSLNDLESASVNPKSLDATPSGLQTANGNMIPKLAPPNSKEEILYPELFGSREVKSKNIAIFPKWTGVMARYERQKATMYEACDTVEGAPCPIREWQDFLQSLQHKPLTKQLVAVNDYMNKIRYVDDKKNWNVNDLWETPMEFLQNNGDCEDYAIAKFISLRLLGVPNEAMRVVIVNDRNIRAIHAVLAVYVDGHAYILDNQIQQLVRADSIHHYQPIYSINETNWWRHRLS